MATEKDLELLDDYLSNRLGDTDKQAFEQKLNADPDLKQELEFQQNLVEGVRHKRVTELKAMLNNIPVTTLPGSQSVMLTKVVVSLLFMGVAGAGLYFYLGDESAVDSPLPDHAQVDQVEEPEHLLHESTEPVTPETEDVSDRIATETKTPARKSPVPAKERLDAATQRERDLVKVVSKTFVTSSTEVVTANGNDEFKFHYAFKNKKLMLYGSFEPNQYQILEFITADEHIFFLNYKSSYYLLDRHNDTPTLLTPIKDGQLLKRLREFRSVQD
jgi:hypothetical protein